MLQETVVFSDLKDNSNHIFREFLSNKNNDGLLVFKNHGESFWRSIYINNQGGLELIPSHRDENGNNVYPGIENEDDALNFAKNWYENKCNESNNIYPINLC